MNIADPFYDLHMDRCGWIANRLIENVNLAGAGEIMNRPGAEVHDSSDILLIIERNTAGVDSFFKISGNIAE